MNANGGMSLSNNFLVKFDVPGFPTGDVFEFYCDEAQLPNVNAATGTIKGRYMGEGQVNYPHTRIFTEMQLGFQCDASMTPLVFLNEWFSTIFAEYSESKETPYPSIDGQKGGTPEAARIPKRDENRTVQLNYPNRYCGNIYVTKTELGPASQGGLRTSITYVMEKAWPYQIDAVPLQFGSAQLTKVTAQFYYAKHRLVYNNLTQTATV